MAKYSALGNYLRRQKTGEVRMTFAEIERIIDAKLPPKAQHHRAWWSNNPSNNVATKEWLDAGFKSEQVDMEGRKLVFRRVSAAPRKPANEAAHGLAEEHRTFKHEEGKELPPHPAVGSMKGLMTVAPGADLSEPLFSEKEWDEFFERKAALLEEGLKRK